MARKKQLKSEIRTLEDDIKFLEMKVNRTMRALMSSILRSKKPPAEEVQYFCAYSAEIDEKCKKLQKLKDELNGLK